MSSFDDDALLGSNDDLSRQRAKRAARTLDLPLVGFGALSLRGVIGQVLTRIEERGDFDARRYLVDQGHSQDTIAAVIGCLRLTDSVHPSRRLSVVDETVDVLEP